MSTTTPDIRRLAQWQNRLQALAVSTGLGIPVSLSTDPRNAFSSTPGTSARAGLFSQPLFRFGDGLQAD